MGLPCIDCPMIFFHSCPCWVLTRCPMLKVSWGADGCFNNSSASTWRTHFFCSPLSLGDIGMPRPFMVGFAICVEPRLHANTCSPYTSLQNAPARNAQSSQGLSTIHQQGRINVALGNVKEPIRNWLCKIELSSWPTNEQTTTLDITIMLKCPTTLIPASVVQIFLWYATRQDIWDTAATSGHLTTASLKLVIK